MSIILVNCAMSKIWDDEKLPVIKLDNCGAQIKMGTLKTTKPTKSELSTVLATCLALFLSVSNNWLNTGMNAADNDPVTNN